MVYNHTYYLPKQRKIIGPLADKVGHILYGMYLRDLGDREPAIHDGSSVWTNAAGGIECAVVRHHGCDGKGRLLYDLITSAQ